jgi:GNAT superfamily N-acetyltransferase
MSQSITFTTKELSERTWPDFEDFFCRNGRTSCACMLYQRGCHLKPRDFPSREEWRGQSLRDKRRLVEEDSAHGILVYKDGEPVGWCQYGPVEELPLVRGRRTSARLLPRDPTSRWRITCFLTLMPYRRQGVADVALAAAVEAVRRRGGGWIEAIPMAGIYYDPLLQKLDKEYGPHSKELEERLRAWPEVVVPQLGTVKATGAAARGAGHQGIMSMFERIGFKAVRLDPVQPGYVLMRLEV